MLTRDQVVEIRVLRRQGLGVRAIARALGVSHMTVRRYLKGDDVGRYKARAPRRTKLQPFVEYVQARVEAAKPHWIPATVLLREVRERGYTGQISQLKALLAPMKMVPADPVVRFETAPGEQLQADFVVVRRGARPLLAFVATLGYSRASFVRFTASEDTVALCACLEDALHAFGGVPKHVLFDNPKTVVIERDAYGAGRHRFNAALLEVAEAYGFQVRLCRPYRAKTKGKVERFNRYLRSSFLVPLTASLKQAGLHLDVEAANAHIGPWLDGVANRRVHATTGEQPCARLILERAHLGALPVMAAKTLVITPPATRPTPIESLQHPLSVYESLLEAAP